jgi:hypothetical protein
MLYYDLPHDIDQGRPYFSSIPQEARDTFARNQALYQMIKKLGVTPDLKHDAQYHSLLDRYASKVTTLSSHLQIGYALADHNGELQDLVPGSHDRTALTIAFVTQQMTAENSALQKGIDDSTIIETYRHVLMSPKTQETAEALTIAALQGFQDNIRTILDTKKQSFIDKNMNATSAEEQGQIWTRLCTTGRLLSSQFIAHDWLNSGRNRQDDVSPDWLIKKMNQGCCT